ncbi:MAG: hypothetical protein ABI743_10865, partial [bacterium]
MSPRRYPIIPAPILAGLFACLVACQHDGTPAASPDPTTPTIAVPQSLPIDAQTGVGLLGLYRGEADLEGNVTLAPVSFRRGDAIGDNFVVDLTSILGEGAPCADCVRVTDIGIDGTKLDISLGIQHPFPEGPNPSQGTPTSRNDLHVFDVRGYMIPQSNGPAPIAMPGVLLDLDGNGTKETEASVIAGHLVNPDGYGDEIQLFAESFLGDLPGNVHPFKDYCWDPTAGNYSASNPNGFASVKQPTGQNVFREGRVMGDPGTIVTYKLQTVDGHVNFFWALTCAYGSSATFPLSVANPKQLGARANPKYFLPAMHRPEAVRVTANMDHGLGASDPGSLANLTVTVIDWQRARVPKGAPLVLADTPTTIAWGSDVKEVVVDVPGVLTTPIVRQIPDTGDGSPDNPYQFVISISNQALAIQGKYPGLIAVRDRLEDHVPTTPVGVRRDLSPINIREYTAFQGILVQVGAATAGTYAVDPTRGNIDLTNPSYAGRTGPDVVLDLAVVHQGDPTADGVYMPATGNNGLVRYLLDYSAASLYGTAITPLYTSNVVPDPGNPPPGFNPTLKLPISHLDLGQDATGFASVVEDYNAMLFDEQEDPPGTQTGQRDLANSNLVFNYYRSTDPPSGVGPVLWFEDKTSANTGQPFAFLPGTYNDNTATPDNEFTISLADNPIPVDVFEVGDPGDGDSYYGCIWRNSLDATDGNRPFQILRAKGKVPGTTRGLNATGLINQLKFTVPDFSAIHLVAADMAYLGGGTEEIWLAYSTNHLVALRWNGVAGEPGQNPEGTPRSNISLAAGIPIDIELLPMVTGLPRTINGQLQTSPIVLVLTDSGTIEVLNNVYGAAPTVMQSINLFDLGVLGEPK